MGKIVISFMSNEGKSQNPDNLFAILDTKTQNLERIKLSHLPNTTNFAHGMGTSYNGNYFCAGIIPIRERLASNIFTINLKTGEKKITYLFFTKAIHGMTSLAPNRLLVSSTQTDCLIELCIKNGHIITEDLYHHFLSPEDWKDLRRKFCDDINNINTNYRGPCYVDDNFHANSVFKYKGEIYGTTFKSVIGKQGEKGWGSLFNVSTGQLILNNLLQPHTAFIDSKGQICCCSSYDFTFVVKDKFIVELDGYTRGICEDQSEGGYWIGISAYRKYNAKTSKWIEHYRGDQPLKGARIQFVDYEGNIKNTVELAQYGKEIFDLLPLKKGAWNK